MTQPPISPDGHYYWDGTAWQPMPPPAATSGAAVAPPPPPTAAGDLTTGGGMPPPPPPAPYAQPVVYAPPRAPMTAADLLSWAAPILALGTSAILLLTFIAGLSKDSGYGTFSTIGSRFDTFRLELGLVMGISALVLLVLPPLVVAVVRATEGAADRYGALSLKVTLANAALMLLFTILFFTEVGNASGWDVTLESLLSLIAIAVGGLLCWAGLKQRGQRLI